MPQCIRNAPSDPQVFTIDGPGMGVCRAYAVVRAPSLQPLKQYRISVSPQGPAVSSAEEFGKQPLTAGAGTGMSANTTNSTDRSTFLFWTAPVRNTFTAMANLPDLSFLEGIVKQTTTIEKQVCTMPPMFGNC
jgi:hypothetical protein